MKTRNLISYLFATGFMAAPLCAQTGAVPKLINYQGKLVNPAGAVVADGNYSVRFELFAAPASGVLVWGETRSVAVVGGFFNIALGGAGASPVAGAAVNDISFAFTSSERYLQTTIVSGPGISSEQTLLPRQQMTSVPYAISAQNGVPPGTVVPFAGATAPEGWKLCDGSACSSADPRYKGLYSVIGVTYGSGITGEFKVPDMRGRSAVGMDNMGGDAANRVTGNGLGNSGINGTLLGASGGAQTHTLNVAELPTHSHRLAQGEARVNLVPVNPGPSGGNSVKARYAYFNGDVYYTFQNGDSSGPAGDDQPHNNMPPSIILNYIIKL